MRILVVCFLVMLCALGNEAQSTPAEGAGDEVCARHGAPAGGAREAANAWRCWRGVVAVRGLAGAARALPAGAHNADSATRCSHPSCDPVHVVQEDASNNATRRIALGLTLETDPALLSREMYRAITDGNVTKVPCPCVNKLFFIFPKRRRSPTKQTRICRSDSG